MTTGTTSSISPPDEQNGSEAPKSPSKPLARTRSPTPPVDEPSRKRRRPESPSPEEPRGQNVETTSDTLESNEIDSKVKDSVLPTAEQSSGDASNEDSAKDPVSGQENEEEEAEEGELPPLPPGPPPEEPPSDGWEAIWEPNVGQYYFYNHQTGETTWTNPRVPPTEAESAPDAEPKRTTPYTGYDPAIHGDYDPTASYAQQPERTPSPSIDPYVAHAAFNRFTGKFQNGPGAEQYTDESRAKRQMEIYFDVDAAANCHDGRSLKAERQAKKLTKKEVKAFREKTRLKKEEKKRAWLRD
ncbi:uncharacterized protein DFL_008430 [Arthrobotrys flagrans]|uniref:WW domain-containing protein n=1 Tax=Arthrobotrys flagrans TaxID=97331 RepID=A0A436ZNT3_ARTFL|nr:hypothetical protein DFL_008430 [Arthrobotrys flagrans]